jgi:hypothetical protein
MGKLKPLKYSRFIHVLCLMDAYLAPEQHGAFMIYQSSGTGYFPTPRGPQCAFHSRGKDEWVTVPEIEYVLSHLRYSAKVFIETEAALLIPKDTASTPPIQPHLEK